MKQNEGGKARGGKKEKIIYSAYLWSCTSVLYHQENCIKSPHRRNEPLTRGEERSGEGRERERKNEAASRYNEFLRG